MRLKVSLFLSHCPDVSYLFLLSLWTAQRLGLCHSQALQGEKLGLLNFDPTAGFHNASVLWAESLGSVSAGAPHPCTEMPQAEAAFSLINSQPAEQPPWWAGWACYSYLTVEEIKTQSFQGMQLVKD